MKPIRRACFLAPTLTAILLTHTPAHAVGIWDGTTGNFDDPLNWDNDLVPTAVNTNVSNGGTIQVTTDHTTGDILAGTNASSTGTWSQSAGNLTMTAGWFRLGTAAAATGNFNLSGGTLTTVGRQNIGEAAGASGNVNVTGGIWNSPTDNALAVGGNSAATAGGTGTLMLSGSGTINSKQEFWVGAGTGSIGTFTMTGGTLNGSSWVAIGRSGGTGTANMSGGTWTKTGAGTNFIVGSTGSGTMNLSGGLLDVQTGVTWLGESAGSTFTLSGTGELRTTQVIVGVNAASNATAALNGGTLRTGQILGGAGATKTVAFNGTQIVATANQAAFISNLGGATIGNGGLKIDSNGFNVASAQNFTAAGTGGLVKSGAGILTLTGANTFTGPVAINGGTLITGTPGSVAGWNNGSISVAAGNGFGARLGTGGFSNAEFDQLLSSSVFAAGSFIGINTSLADVTYTDNLGTKTAALTQVGLVKAGTGNLTLNLASQTFTGGIRLGEGTLVLDHATNVSYGGTITGTGGLTVQGAGTTTLTGTANQTGLLNVNGAGGVRVTTAGASLTVQNGIIIGNATMGHFTQTTGIVNISGGEFWLADSVGSTGDYNISGDAVLTVNNWFAIGRRSGQAQFNMTGGTVNKTGAGNVTISTGTGGAASINQSGGIFNNTGSQTFVGESFTGDGNGTWNLSGTGQANLRDVIIGNGGASTGTVNLDGGTLTATKFSDNTTGVSTFNFNGGVLRAGASEAAFMQGLSFANVKAGGANINTNGFDITVNQALLAAGGGLTKSGVGNLTLGGANTYTGATKVTAGTLTIGVGGSLATSSTIDIAAGATLNMAPAGPWTLATGQSLTGNGTVGGAVIIAAGCSIAPGNSVGVLNFSDNLTLLGTAMMEVQNGGNDMIKVLGGLVYGGTLSLTNIGGALSSPVTFDLFDSASQSGTFTSITLPTLSNGLSWSAFNYANGSISIVPEPSAALLTGIGLLGLLTRRRRD